jgi:iron complex transport system ATP-binding protein
LTAAALEPSATVVEARGLALGYDDRIVVSGLDLSIAARGSLAVVGANGCGKSTLLRALAGLLASRAGALTWEGQPRAARVGFLPQDEKPAPFDVRTQVTLGLGIDGAPSAAQRRLVDQALADLGLASLAGRACARLSGGEWQRARLARALVSGPRLVLFDEPTNHLDPVWRADILGLCDRLRGSLALVVATHDLDLAARCDRVLLLAAGRTLALGRPAGVLTPALLGHALQARVRVVIPAGEARPFFRVEAGRA